MPARTREADAGDGALVDLSILEQVIAGTGPVALNLIVPLDALVNRESTAVAELADHGIFLTAEHAREIMLQPGTTLHRIVTDPITGACIERTAKGYRPDTAMRDLARAMDVMCRAPGCTVPASRCELDHETPYNHANPEAGGRTRASNLPIKDTVHHNDKTRGLVETLMEPVTRCVGWRTLFGRIYNTYPHDYTQYSRRPDDSTACTAALREEPASSGAPDAGPLAARSLPPWPTLLDSPDGPDLNDIDVRDRLIYAALTERAVCEDANLAGWDDFEAADMDYPFTPDVGLVHHTSGGAPRRGPDKDHPTTEDLLNPHQPTQAERRAAAQEARHRADNQTPPPF